MEKYFGEKQERFSFRKLSVGLVSATISSLFFMSVLASSSVDAQETAGVHYKYVADSELSSEEKKQLVYDIPTYVENDDETYYLVYKLNSQNQLAELPNTGSKNERQALVAGASLAALGILIFAVSKKKVKNKTVLHLVLVAGMGNGVLVSVHALENHLLLNYNTDYELTSGEKLPLPKEISGYTYIGYIKEGKTTSDFEVSNQEKSAATPTKQQKVDYNVTPNFVDHPSTVQAIQEQTPVSSTKPTEVQVVEKPFSTELINPRKEEKQSSDSQEQLAEHKNLETKKEEKISPKEKTGVNTLNPQDEVLSGQLNKPELLYHEETIETKIDFQEEIQENPDLAEGTVRVKQEGKLGKKVEIVRIFSVNKEEVSREIVSTSTTAPSPRIVEKGTKKTQVIKEQPETGVEHKDVQSGAIVEPAIQPELPEAVVSDKGEPEVQPTLPEAVVTDKGETEVQPESPDTVVSDKGEPEQVAPLPKYKGNIEQVKPETPVEKTKEQGPEKTEEVPVKPTEETPVNPNEGTTEGTSIQETENPVQPAEESTTNSEKVSPDTSSENTGEVSSNPSDSTTSVGESNKPENNDSKNENSEKTGEEVPVNPNEGTVEGTSNQETENPVVLSDVNVTNGNAITGYHYNEMKVKDTFSSKDNRVYNVTLVKDEVVSKESFEERGTMLDASQIASKKAEINPLILPTVEPLSTSGKKDSDFSKVAYYQAKRNLTYKNIEKLLPFYNKATIVKYGNLVNENSLLYQKELLSAVVMKDNQVITDIVSNKQTANKLLLHYKDDLSEKLDLKYQNDFAKLAEYSLGNTGLLYTPNQFLYDQTSIIKQVLLDLQKVDYHSEAIRKTLGISPNVKQTELYLEDQFAKTKQQLEDSLKKLLSADAGLASANPVTEGYLVDKIKRNKEALLLGLTYLERWYNFSYGQVNVKDLVLYHLDFFGKGNASPLDTLIELGKSGFNNLLAKNNVDTYGISLASQHGTTDLFSTLEHYRKVFLPNTSNNDWFKSETKAYIVEEKSTIEEVKTKQGLASTKYSIGVYDRITSATWKYRNMVLPLLTLPERSVFVISTMSSLGFGAYDRYRSSDHKAGKALNDFVEENARETAKRQRDHYDYWYRILDDNAREKLYRNILLYDAYKFGDDNTVGKATEVADFDNPNPAMQHFFGPVGNKVGHNQHGAYATGDAVYYMGYRMLDKDGAITYTHEMTHDSDQDIYLGGYGRRSGLGPEFFAKGLLQAPDHPDDATITINSILKHSKSDSTESRRLQVLDPTTRFNNADDLKQYVHNMFDVVYMLEYLEGNSILKLDTNQKQQLLRKVTNEYHPDPDGNKVYATNVVRNLTVEEVERLRSFNDLIDNNILSSREYASGKYERNGYFTIKLFAPIYAALSNDIGTPGDLMGRRIAYELLAAKGFKDGMVPYISNQYEEEAKQKGKTINLYGKTRGLVTDDLVLEKVFNNQYHTWSEFKKAMYQERQDQFDRLNKVTFNDTTQPWQTFAKKTTSSVDELQKLMDVAVRKDAEHNYYHWNNYNPDIDSEVHKLKRAIFKAYLDQTNDFRSSIFENKK
ncbi:TPA: ZmpA/ZmpB/ZmpC family metallo-endopeptidase [Streptococcus pneumoniae]